MRDMEQMMNSQQQQQQEGAIPDAVTVDTSTESNEITDREVK